MARSGGASSRCRRASPPEAVPRASPSRRRGETPPRAQASVEPPGGPVRLLNLERQPRQPPVGAEPLAVPAEMPRHPAPPPGRRDGEIRQQRGGGARRQQLRDERPEAALPRHIELAQPLPARLLARVQ
eukprot:CAMPEP_0196709210 /NCGR_PEP_ID=MMETSP1090-20130531/67646_1 /TAXON_ID=37098 /ORGANISM="Isochrysis sp, Strain CCMP1244" /LENGTH=128 /DNA_ID=CAMNT_0042049221 /DNA_START=187 /DNA_END=571 /DNA_ORIENTATION=+